MKYIRQISCAGLACLALSVSAQAVLPKRPKHPSLPPEERVRVIAPAVEGELRLTPTFNSVGVAWGSEKEVAGLSLEYRAARPACLCIRDPKGEDDGDWETAEFGCAWFGDVKNYRGSIYGLEENADYEVRIAVEGKTIIKDRVHTWSSEVPIAKTVEIPAGQADKMLVISDRGEPDGWIKYVVRGGEFAGADGASAAIMFTNAAYVVLDDSKIRGRRCVSAIVIANSEFIRIRNCDISEWGEDGMLPRYDQRGQYYRVWNGKKQRYVGGNHSGGIDILRGAKGVVVERCYIHEPYSRAHSWRYSHPYGPMAIRLSDSAGNQVIRWNDLVGCDAHRFDDTIGGGNDFYELGTFNRDSDIYGNFIAFANDDCLEIDGGQQNVRVFGNRFEAGFMGVSVQGNLVSPSYVFDNVFTGCVDEFDKPSSSIKTSGIDLFDYRPNCYIFDNVFWGRGTGIPLAKNTAKLNVRRNLCYGPEQKIVGIGKDTPYLVVADNKTNQTANACPTGDWPRRPIPYVTDISRIDGVTLAKGVVSPAAVKVTLKCGGSSYRQPFEVKMNDKSGWVKVSPMKGVIESGKSITFDVAFDAEKMANVRLRRAAFMIRTADGFSRAVTVYGETDFEQPFKCEKAGQVAIYADVDPKNPYKKYEFNVPKDGRYYFMLRARANELTGTGVGKLGNRVTDTFMAAADDDKMDVCTYQLHDWSSWMNVAPGGTYMCWIKYYDFKQGVHTIEIAPNKGGAAIEGLVLTDAPGEFEPELNKFNE